MNIRLFKVLIFLNMIFLDSIVLNPNDKIKFQLIDLNEGTFKREEVFNSLLKKVENNQYQKVNEALTHLSDNIYLRFNSKFFRQNLGILMCPLLLICFYTQQKKKKCTSKILPSSSPFNTKMPIVINYIFFDQSFLKLNYTRQKRNAPERFSH